MKHSASVLFAERGDILKHTVNRWHFPGLGTNGSRVGVCETCSLEHSASETLARNQGTVTYFLDHSKANPNAHSSQFETVCKCKGIGRFTDKRARCRDNALGKHLLLRKCGHGYD